MLLLSAVLLLAAAGCGKTNTSNDSSQNNQQGDQNGQNQSASTQTYRNDTYGFEFQYPDDMSFVTPKYALLQDKIVELGIPQNQYPKTNFGDAAFSVSASYAKSKAECLSMNAPENGDGFKNAITINGIQFYTTTTSGAAAGNRYDGTTYRTLVGNQTCIELTETIHTSVLENYPAGTVTEVDSQSVRNRLNQVLYSFKFTNNK